MPGLHTPSGDRLSSRDKAWVIFGIFAIGLPAVVSIAIFAFGITPSFWQESRSVQSQDFSYRLRGEDWIVLFGDSYEQLWEKKQPRDLSTHGQVLDQRHGEFYWIGIHIQPEWLRQAKAEGADQLMSGYIYGTYEAYIDDRLVKTGGAGETRRPVVIELTDEMLNRPQGFRYSLRIRHDLNEPYPDTLHYIGLATKAQIELHRRSTVLALSEVWVVGWWRKLSLASTRRSPSGVEKSYRPKVIRSPFSLISPRTTTL